MKRLTSLFLALIMVLSLAVTVSADEADLAADGWSVANDNFLGWTKEGDVITGDFNVGWENAEPMSLWQDMITDYNNFCIELDMTANNMTSPAIAVMGVRIETDGNGGDGHQVYLKTNNTEGFEGRNQTYDWIKAANSKVHVTIARKDGGDLHILIVGESNDSVQGECKLITVPVTVETSEISISVYRGCAKFGSLTVTQGESVELPTEPQPTVPPTEPSEPEATEPTNPANPTGPKDPSEPADTQPDPGASDNDGNDSTFLIVAIVAVVVIAVVAVVIIRKKKQ